ncbi:Endonuclease/exonuclease/phosphatase [Peniophora sp. CONT]|nr:Endonuclease/exonuclease/phosphatase [Peniophora sp. CONT]
MTWNLLAQCLVRRKLFPTSDCLKGGQRLAMTYEELLAPRADIICLQETDRLEKLLPVLDKAGYDHSYASGPRKKHGCCIAWRRNAFSKVDSKVLYYDDEPGLSFRTRNIAHIVALRRVDSEDGIVVATTHLFWHPAYIYERSRQAALLQRTTRAFRATHGPSWPAIIAGDFNFAPHEAAYALMLRQPLSSAHRAKLAGSRVVHKSVDPAIAPEEIRKPEKVELAATAQENTEAEGDEGEGEGEEGEEEGGGDPDRVLVNTRPPRPEDGLLDDAALEELYRLGDEPAPCSAYDEGQRARAVAGATDVDAQRCGERLGIDRNSLGAYEPEYTNYTFYWKLTLDYVFLLDPPGSRSKVLRLLAPHKAEDLGDGLPKKGISASDHVSLAAELQWTKLEA